MKTPHFPALFLSCALIFTSVLMGDEFTFSTGYDYSTGDYGLPISTEITTIPLSVSYTLNRTTWDLSMPYLKIDGPGEVVPGIGRFARRLQLQKKTTRGPGDLTLGVTHDFQSLSDQPWSWSAGAEVKMGTASTDKFLGTGKEDFSTHVDWYYSAGSLTPFVTLGYRWLGNPVGSDLLDYWFGSLGINWACTERTSIALLVDWAERNSASGSTSSNFIGSISRSFGDDWSVSIYGVMGNSDATADHGMGLSLRRRF